MNRKQGTLGAMLGILLLVAVLSVQSWLGNDAKDGARQDLHTQHQQTPASAAPIVRTFSAQVVRVADGDTLTCTLDGQNQRVRLFGIDSPEVSQPGYEQAQETLRQAAQDRTVEVRVVDVDQYDRIVARVILPGADGRKEIDINRKMIAEGWAWWYRTYAPDEQDLASAEETARTAQLGIWGMSDPLPPWEFRRRARENGK
ncbi:MAG: thermonuclease family protein [Pirellulales bacterium]|nr:thermonuclease family protein [Pirellulales bacterium]